MVKLFVTIYTHSVWFFRLAEERQQIVEKAKTPNIIPQEKLVDSFKAAGVENFHMKAAVPGTEIPGHKVCGFIYFFANNFCPDVKNEQMLI